MIVDCSGRAQLGLRASQLTLFSTLLLSLLCYPHANLKLLITTTTYKER